MFDQNHPGRQLLGERNGAPENERKSRNCEDRPAARLPSDPVFGLARGRDRAARAVGTAHNSPISYKKSSIANCDPMLTLGSSFSFFSSESSALLLK